MISKQEIKVMMHLAASAKEILSSLEDALDKGDKERSGKLKNELIKINEEIRKKVTIKINEEIKKR